MDLFDMLSIDSESPKVTDNGKKNNKPKTETKADAKKSAKDAKDAKAKAMKSSAKPASPPSAKSMTQADLRKRLVGLDWTIHYASHSFSAEALGRQLVEVDEHVDIETVRAALYNLLQSDVKEILDAARSSRAKATVVDGEFVPVENQEPIVIETPIDEEAVVEEEDLEDDLELDEETDEIKPKSPVETGIGTANPVAELIEGDLTIDMLRQALALEYFEFANEDSVQWRVDTETKRLFPSITAAKMGAGTAMKGMFWNYSEYLNEPKVKPINIVASRDGRLYEIRESNHIRVTAAEPVVRELEEVIEGITLKMPRVPGQLLVQTILFFRHFAKKNLEALVYIAWNRVTEQYELHCPKQRVTVVEVVAEYPLHDPDRDICIIIHSHHDMDAYFSPADNRNDQALCVYGVLGHLNGILQHKFRAGFNGKHFNLSVEDVFDLAATTGDSEFPEEWLTMVECV